MDGLRRKAQVVVVGSFVMDLVLWLPHLPKVGQALHPTRFEQHLGGRGFNQATAAVRAGTEVSMLGALGADPFGLTFTEALRASGITDAGVVRVSEPTSFTLPLLLPSGESSIIGVPRSNKALRPEHVERAGAAIGSADLLLLQNEIPVETSRRAAELARGSRVEIMLTPAPVKGDVEQLIPLVDWVVLNQLEAEQLTGVPTAGPAEAQRVARTLLARGVRRGVVVTLGQEGAVLVDAEHTATCPALPVTPVDRTGAGDAFVGHFGAALASGVAPLEALRRGCIAGSLATLIPGAEPSMPSAAQVNTALKTHM